MRRFYVWWIVLYWMWVFLFLGDYLKTRSFTTLYDRCAAAKRFARQNYLRASARKRPPPDILFARACAAHASSRRSVASNQLQSLFGSDPKAM